jgi:competence protein ComEC
MSFACVAGIQLFDAPISAWLIGKLGAPQGMGWKARLKRWFVSSISISLSAIVLTTPISAYYFGTISLVGVLTNLVTLWAVGLSFYGIVAALAVSLVWMPGAVAIAKLASLTMGFVIAVAKLLSSLPLAAVYTASPYIVLWLIFVYILLTVFLLSKNRYPVILSCCAVLGLCLALLLSWTEYRLSDVHFTALDVGQGQCLILHTKGETFLIDCGGSNDEITANAAVDTLLSRGVTRLDGIILTHGDRDHAGGLDHLLERIDTDLILVPSTSAMDVPGQRVIEVAEDLTITAGSGKITVFGPTFSPESNENSLCILFEGEKCAILVTGDRSRTGELLLLRSGNLPDVDLLIAGHHGSKNSTSEELLTAVSPETVFISVGRDNAYGHPSGETLKRLMDHGCRVYRTDIMGNLIFRR